MENKPQKTYLIGGIIFALMAVGQLISALQYTFTLGTIIALAANLLVAVPMLTRKRNLLPAVGFGLMALNQAVSIIKNFKPSEYGYNPYMVEEWSYYGGDSYHFNPLTMLPDLAFLVGFAMAAVFILAMVKKSDLYDKAMRLWFLPGALVLGRVVLGIVLMLLLNTLGLSRGWWVSGYSYVNFRLILNSVLSAGGVLGVILWTGYPYGLPKTVGNVSMYGVEKKAYCGMAKHLLLFIFTLGIWAFIWIYRMTRYLNIVEDEEPRSPGGQVVRCMFVPFYVIYWFYKTAQRLDKLAASKNIHSNLTVLCLVLAAFAPIVPPILVQDMVNTILTKPQGSAPAVQPVTVQPAEYTAAPVYQPVQETVEFDDLPEL